VRNLTYVHIKVAIRGLLNHLIWLHMKELINLKTCSIRPDIIMRWKSKKKVMKEWKVKMKIWKIIKTKVLICMDSRCLIWISSNHSNNSLYLVLKNILISSHHSNNKTYLMLTMWSLEHKDYKQILKFNNTNKCFKHIENTKILISRVWEIKILLQWIVN
jgi:hypothetical protein